MKTLVTTVIADFLIKTKITFFAQYQLKLNQVMKANCEHHRVTISKYYYSFLSN